MSSLSHKHKARFEDPLTFLFRARTKLYSLWLSAIYPFASKGRNLSIHYPCRISRRVANEIWLGNSVIIWNDVWLNIHGDSENELRIVIDDNCTLGARSMISAKNSVHIERN